MHLHITKFVSHYFNNFIIKFVRAYSWLWILRLIESPNMIYIHLKLISNSKMSVHLLVTCMLISFCDAMSSILLVPGWSSDVDRWTVIPVSLHYFLHWFHRYYNIHLDNLMVTTQVPYTNTQMCIRDRCRWLLMYLG